MAQNKTDSTISNSLAKSDNGNIEITFQIPYSLIKTHKEEALSHMAEEVEVPGFRKGKAPLSQVEPRVNQNTLIERTLSKLLPKALGEAIDKYKIKPVIYPKFELIKAADDADWEIKAITCELPEVPLGDYKKEISAMAKASGIWTPDKGKADKNEKKELSQEEKEQQIIQYLITNITVNVPKILIDEEVNNRLAGLLQRIERLGLTLEGYLGSLGKDVESLRKEYEEQAKNSIALELILEKIADQEKITIDENKISEAITAASAADPNLSKNMENSEQRKVVASVLKRREALSSLAALI